MLKTFQRELDSQYVSQHCEIRHSVIPKLSYSQEDTSTASNKTFLSPVLSSASGNARPSTRPVLTGNGNRSPVNSGRQLG